MLTPRDKANEIVNKAPRRGEKLVLGEHEITFTDYVRAGLDWSIVINAAITRNGVPLNISMPLHIVNPPVDVDDPAGDIAIQDEEGNITYRVIDGRRALEEILSSFLSRI